MCVYYNSSLNNPKLGTCIYITQTTF